MSGELADVIGGETITANFTNEVKDRSVMRYTDATERDSLLPTPVTGDVAFLENGATFSELTIYGTSQVAGDPVLGWHTVWAGDPDATEYVAKTGGTMSGQLTMDADTIRIQSSGSLVLDNSSLTSDDASPSIQQVTYDTSTGLFHRRAIP